MTKAFSAYLKKLGIDPAEVARTYVALFESVVAFNKTVAHLNRQIFCGHNQYVIRTLDGKDLTWRRSLESAMKVVRDEFPDSQVHVPADPDRDLREKTIAHLEEIMKSDGH
jgi:hypothetical protein